MTGLARPRWGQASGDHPGVYPDSHAILLVWRCHTALPYSVATQAVWQRHEKEDGDEAENGYPPTQPEIFAIMIAKI